MWNLLVWQLPAAVTAALVRLSLIVKLGKHYCNVLVFSIDVPPAGTEPTEEPLSQWLGASEKDEAPDCTTQ